MENPEDERTDLSRILPLSYGQRSIWMGQKYIGEESPAFVIGGTYRIRGPIDKDLLNDALEVLIRRNRTLRSFLRPGEPFPCLEPQEAFKVPFTFHDVSKLPDPASEAKKISEHTAQEPFVFYNSPLCRFTLIKESESKYYFVITYHHIVADGVSGIIVFNEMAQAYNQLLGRTDSLMPEPVDYEEFLKLEQQYEASEKFREDHDFWREHLEDADASPLFHPLPGCETGFGKTERLYRLIPSGLFERLIEPAKEAGATPTSTLLAATSLFLSRLLDRDRLIVGFPYLNRKSKRQRQIVGQFVNGLPLGISLNQEESFVSAAVQAARLLRKIMRHASYPVDEVVSELGIRSQDSGTVFQVSFNHVAKSSVAHLGEAEVENVSVNTNRQERHILYVSFWEINEGGDVEISLDYCLNYFTPEAAETLLDRFLAFLERLADSPALPYSDLEILLPEEAFKIERWSCGPTIVRDLDRGIHESFEKTALARAALPAVVEENSLINYGDLDVSANRVSNALLAAGVGRGEPVGVLACRSLALAATVLGIFKAGGCYVPLDPDYPAERIRFIVKDAGIKSVITLCEPSCSIPARLIPFSETQLYAGSNPGVSGNGSDPAYIIYTSGSTGTPKGVVIEHGGFLNMIAGQIEFLAMRPEDRVLLFASPSFDASLSELFMALLSGAALCPVGRELIEAPWDLRDYMTRLGVSVATFPPSYLRVFEGSDLPGMRALITAGEPPNPEDARSYAARLIYINAYGPTENSVCSTMGRVLPDYKGPITIGKPVANVRTYILDRNLRPVPPGVFGELCLAGPGLAREYLNRPDLTSQFFRKAPFPPHERIYCSGDLARWTPSGDIEFLGRKDDQIKVRGFRVEPGEIENVLASHPAVLQAAVVATSTGGACGLSGFVVSKPADSPLLPEEIRDWASSRLPAYMNPSRIFIVESLPTSGSGKIDRRKLSEMSHEGAPETEFIEPRTETESTLAGIWRACLKEGPIGGRDDFFARGGNSLLAIRMIQLVNDTFCISIPTRSVFKTPILRDLAVLIDSAVRASAEAHVKEKVKGEDPGQKNVHLSQAQRQLWVIQQMVDRPEVYNMPAVFDVESTHPLDEKIWEEALRYVIDRHESLRTIFVDDEGLPVRKVLETVSFNLERAECLSRLEAVALATDRVHVPFNPDEPPLIRAGLLRYGPGRAIFFLCIHHLVGDGESILIMMDELAGILAGSRPTSPAAPYSLAVAEEMSYLASADAASDREWWLKYLKPPFPSIDLGEQAFRPGVKQYSGARLSMHIPSKTVSDLEDLARRSRSSLFSLILSLVKMLIYRRTGEGDIIVGIPSTTRTGAEHEGSVGYYVNTLAIRDLLEAEWSFEDLLSRVQASVAAAVAHGAYPFARLYSDLGLERNPSRSPLFDVMLAPQPGAGQIVRNGFVFSNVDIEVRAARFDLTFTYGEDKDGGLVVFADYDCALFSEQDVASILEELSGLAQEVLSNSRTPICGSAHPKPSGKACGSAKRKAATDDPSFSDLKGGIGLLKEAWESVLNHSAKASDNFFSLGGDSIKAIQVCGRLRKHGLKLSPRQIFENPILGDLARLLDDMAKEGLSFDPSSSNLPDGIKTSGFPLTPIQRWLFEDHPESAPSFLMNILLKIERDIDSSIIEKALKKVTSRHEAFRLQFEDVEYGMARRDEEAAEIYWRVRPLGEGESVEDTLKALAPMLHRRIDPGRGCHLAALLMTSPGQSRLYLAAHHLVMDAVSWRILIDDLESALTSGDRDLPAPTAPFASWAVELARYASGAPLREELPYWRSVCSAPSAGLPILDETVRNVWTLCSRRGFELNADETRRLITDAVSQNGARPVELLLAALSYSLGRFIKGESITLFMEGHGREPYVSSLDVSRTIGWFTCRYPFSLSLGHKSFGSALLRVLKDFRAVPKSGVGYSVLRRLASENIKARADVMFNYLGEFSGGLKILSPAPENVPSPVGPEYESDTRLEFLAVILEGKLRVEALFNPSILDSTWIEGLMGEFEDVLWELVKPTSKAVPPGPMPEKERISFRILEQSESKKNKQQMTFKLDGAADMLHVLDAWRFVASRHESFGAVFPQALHVFILKDFSGLSEETRIREVEVFLDSEKSRELDTENGPVFRAAVVRLKPDEHLLVWTFAKELMDGLEIDSLLQETTETIGHLETGFDPSLSFI